MVPFQPEEDAAQMRQLSGNSRRVKGVPRDTQFLAHPSVASQTLIWLALNIVGTQESASVNL
jgi:hypothetical protein